MAMLTGIGIENLLFHRQVRGAGEDKARFILATTHDLRSPMATIEQIVMLLLDGYAGPLADRQRDLLVRVRSRGRHQLQLISDLLNLAAEEDAFLIPRDTVTSDLGGALRRRGGVGPPRRRGAGQSRSRPGATPVP